MIKNIFICDRCGTTMNFGKFHTVVIHTMPVQGTQPHKDKDPSVDLCDKCYCVVADYLGLNKGV